MSGFTLPSKPLITDIKDSSHYIDSNVRPGDIQLKINQESDNENSDFQQQDRILTAKKPKHFWSLKRLVLLLAAFNITLIVLFSVTIIHMKSENARNKAGSVSNSVTSIDEINKVVQENLASNDFLNIVQKYILCASCDTVRDVKQHFFESVGNNKCCIGTISDLIRILQSTFLKSVNEYNSKVTSLKSSIEDLKEDANILENALFSSNRTNVTDGAGDGIPKENVMWAMIQKNNRLINTLLNRRRSVLHLSGTAGATSIHWVEEMQSGDLSHDKQGIHVRSGGNYFMYCNIHFSKKDCNGTENFEYSINQEYSPGVFLPIARVHKACASGSSVDSGLFVQSVLQVGLGQQSTIRIQYNPNNQAFIAKENRLHDIIIFEI